MPPKTSSLMTRVAPGQWEGVGRFDGHRLCMIQIKRAGAALIWQTSTATSYGTTREKYGICHGKSLRQTLKVAMDAAKEDAELLRTVEHRVRMCHTRGGKGLWKPGDPA